jgi:hypothetical protein
VAAVSEQLDTRRKARRAPPPPERSVHIALARTLDIALSSDFLWFHPANGEKRELKTAQLLVALGVKPGVSDFILAGGPGGQLHALELKRRGLKPSPSQRAFLERVRAVGGKAAYADNFDDALRILKEWGAVRVTLPSLPPEKRLVGYAGKEGS